MASKKFTPRQIIRALDKEDGNKAGAARYLKTTPALINRMCDEFPEVQETLDKILDNRVLITKPNNKFEPDTVIRGIIRARGNLSAAARWLGCSRMTVHNYINKHKEVRIAYEMANSIGLDDVENYLMNNAEHGNVTAQIFYLKTKGKHRGWTENDFLDTSELKPLHIQLPASAIAGKFFLPYRYIQEDRFTEYVLKGGRGSTKSSFASLVIIEHLINNPQVHALACRQVQNTLRDSVFSQIEWAIEYLGLSEYFHSTLSPLEITYAPTNQKIYFRGADDPLKIKSIKPKFGYIGVLWFEELDQFKGAAAVRSVVQSAIRGGDKAFIIKSYNPPRSQNNWVNKEVELPKKNRYIHTSNYLDVPENWLGKVFLDEAKHLKEINLSAYEHEYLGEITGTGGLVFDNLELREITDKDLEEFDQIKHGLDWGYFPDPAHYAKMHYDAARMTLYIFGEVRKWKHGNKKLYNELIKYGLKNSDVLICDSAEPKSVADFRKYGAAARGAEKGPESVRYSMKWLQSLRSIVIDPERCPFTAEEYLNYEHETDKEGNYISEYPDKDNHGIDATRYGTNKIWKRRGQ